MNSTENSGPQNYHHGPFRVEGGELPDAVTAYETYGDKRNPCVVFPTCYGGRVSKPGLVNQIYMIGEDKPLQPSKYFIVTFALFCNGESSSPSNTPPPNNGPNFPFVSYEDNIRAQYAVLTKALGIKKVHAVVGFSMGGQQAYHWAVMYPDFVDRFIALCTSARTSQHNRCFQLGPRAALMASKDFNDGHYKTNPREGVRAFAKAWGAWGYSHGWFKNREYLCGGMFPDLETYLRVGWEDSFVNHWDANDLLALFMTWNKGDISLVRDRGNLEKCLSKIKPKGLIMPCNTDLFFPPEDSEFEVSHMKNAKLVVIDSVWGHMSAGGMNARDDEFIREEVRSFLADFPSHAAHL